MRLLRMVAIAATLCALSPSAGAAQGRVPAAGSMAAGGEVGIFVPDDAFEPSPIVGGFFEYYPSARLSLRPSVMFLDPGFDREPDDSLRQTRIGFDVIYNWEQGRWHPFVGGGVGAHLLRLKDNGRTIGDGSNELGVDGLGGVEYFVNRRNALKFEGRVQFVDDVFGVDPSGFAATVGFKHYF
jgi:hypothetical protein